LKYNEEHQIEPVGIRKAIRDINERVRVVAERRTAYSANSEAASSEMLELIKELEAQMKHAARELEYEKAALLRDEIKDLRRIVDTGVRPGE
jgi:excinuclease ABC subunit B